MGAGPMRMNRVTVGRTAAGLAAWLRGARRSARRRRLRRPHRLRRVRPRHRRGDDRRRVRRPAAARTRCPRRCSPSRSGTSGPTPASWSPPRTTRPPTTATRCTSATAARSFPPSTPRSPPGSTPWAAWPTSRAATTGRRWTTTVLDAYLAHAAALVPVDAPRDLTVVTTAMHGVGGAVMARGTDPGRLRRPPRRRRAAGARPHVPHRRLPQPGGTRRPRPRARAGPRDRCRRRHRPRPRRRPLRRRRPDRRRRGGSSPATRSGGCSGSSSPSTGVDRHLRHHDRLVVAAVADRRRPRPAVRGDADRVQVDRPGARAGLRLRGGDRLLRRPGRRGRQGRHHRRRCASSSSPPG